MPIEIIEPKLHVVKYSGDEILFKYNKAQKKGTVPKNTEPNNVDQNKPSPLNNWIHS